MKSSTAKSFNLCQNLRQTTDHGAVANTYAANLHLCYQHGTTSYSLAPSVHAHMITYGFVPRNHILNRLIDIYCKCSNLNYAKKLFDKIPQPDVVARTTLIAAYSASREPKLAREPWDS